MEQQQTTLSPQELKRDYKALAITLGIVFVTLGITPAEYKEDVSFLVGLSLYIIIRWLQTHNLISI